MSEHLHYFEYNSGGTDIPKDVFKISPSQLSKFLDKTSEWYREHVLDEEAAFQGNTNSVLGTCVHGIAAMYKDGISEDAVEPAVNAYLDTIKDPDIDKAYICNQYATMASTLINQYVCTVGGESEPFISAEVIPGVYAGGSVDLLFPDEIVDYKTTGSLSAPTSVRREYYFQQMSYVWIAKKLGYHIDKFSLIFVTTNEVGRVSEKTGKPMKDYPTTVTKLTHHVTGEDLAIIENVLNLVAESVLAFNKTPEIRHLLAQDQRLKERVSKLFN